MESKLYKAAMEGTVDVLKEYSHDQLNVKITPNGNTVLHVAAQFNKLEFVKAIIQEREVLAVLLRKVNIKGETPLHIAVREGYSDIVRLLIASANKDNDKVLLIRARNKDNDTALHMAVREGNNLEVIKLLISEDPESPHPANYAGETPLYLAAEMGDVGTVSEILQKCTSPSYGGPGRRTALHAAALFYHRDQPDGTDEPDQLIIDRDQPDGTGGSIIRELLNKKPDLIKAPDENGWTPLHYAACGGHVQVVRMLLEKDESAAYVAANWNEKKTALHIAASRDDVNVMKEILSKCPGCWENVNSGGQNVLHIAADMKRKKALDFIMENPWSRHLINQKDSQGNTPLHLLAAVDSSELQYADFNFVAKHRGSYMCSFNNQKLCPLDIILSRKSVVQKTQLIGGGRNIVWENHTYNIKEWERSQREHQKAREDKIKEKGEGLVKMQEDLTTTIIDIDVS